MGEICVIRPTAATTGRQRLGYFLGVSSETCGSTGLAMHLVVIPPGAVAEPLSETDPAVAIIARNDANEQERVVAYAP
jgi:uncharacterized RmlC-like cupin family protein